MAAAEVKWSELASDPCRRHGQKLVNIATAIWFDARESVMMPFRAVLKRVLRVFNEDI